MPDQVTGILSPLLRNIRLQQANRYCSGKVLDYGCGSGVFSVFFADADYVGVDTDAQSLEKARRKFPGKKFYDSDSPEWKTASYDTVVLAAVLEHLRDPENMLKELSGCLNEDGKMVITSPVPKFEFFHSIGAFFRVFSREASGEHCSKIDPAVMTNIARALGMQMTICKRFMFGLNQCFVLQKRKENGKI